LLKLYENISHDECNQTLEEQEDYLGMDFLELLKDVTQTTKDFLAASEQAVNSS
jgi:hypothetical protein